MSRHAERSGRQWKPQAHRLCVLLAVACGAALGALSRTGQAPFWVGWLALLPIFLAIRFSSPLAAIGLAAAWGAALCTAQAMIDAHFLPDLRASATSIGLLATLVTLPAAYAGLSATVTRFIGFRPIVIALGWVVVEIAFSRLGFRQPLAHGDHTNVSPFFLAIERALGYAVVAALGAYIAAWVLNTIVWIEERSRRAGQTRPASANALRKVTWVPRAFAASRQQASSQPRAPPVLQALRLRKFNVRNHIDQRLLVIAAPPDGCSM